MAEITIHYKFSEAAPLHLHNCLRILEKEIIMLALHECKNVKTTAAKLLTLNRTTLLEKMRRHEIPLNPLHYRRK